MDIKITKQFTYRRTNKGQISPVWWSYVKVKGVAKPFRQSCYTTNEQEATLLLADRVKAIIKGVTPLDGKTAEKPIRMDLVTYEELKQDYLADYRTNNGETEGYRRLLNCLKRLDRHFKGQKARAITQLEIERYKKKRQGQRSGTGKPVANATINRELAVLKRMFRLAFLLDNPKVAKVPTINMLKEPRKKQSRIFEPDEFEAFRAVLAEDFPYLEGPVLFGARTGWRQENVLSLKKHEVDLVNGVAIKQGDETKNNEVLVAALSEELVEIMAREIERSQCEYVFSRKDAQDRIFNFRQGWNVALEKAGIGGGYAIRKPTVYYAGGGPTFHDLRHTMVTDAIEAGVPDALIMEMTGHKTRNMIDRYKHVRVRAKARAMEAIKRYNAKRARPRIEYNTGQNPDTTKNSPAKIVSISAT